MEENHADQPGRCLSSGPEAPPLADHDSMSAKMAKILFIEHSGKQQPVDAVAPGVAVVAPAP
jgi:hypothetical protein